jgi:hypothetical protein
LIVYGLKGDYFNSKSKIVGIILIMINILDDQTLLI